MPLYINTNVSSLNSQRQLVNSGKEMDQAMERLSSGKRVNNAADDAAGLAIANRMTSQILGLNQAIRNANDGVSLIQTAEGALDEVTNILQRMRELSIQSANGIYSDTDRATLDAEVQQLKAELDRIASSTTFNGQTILDGSLSDVTLQVGSQGADTIGLSITAMNTDSLGGGNSADVVGIPVSTTFSQAGDLVTGDAASAGSLSINGQSVGDLSSAENLQDILNQFNERVSGVDTTAFIEITATADGDGVLRGTNILTLTLTDFESNSQTYEIAETGSMNDLVDRINDVTAGVIQASLNENNRLVLASTAGAAIQADYTGATIANVGLVDASVGRAQLAFDITDDTIENIDIAVASGTSVAANILAIQQAFGIQARTDSDITSAANTTQAAITEGQFVINDIALSGMAAGTGASGQATNLAAMINSRSDDHGVVATITTIGTAAAENGIVLNSVDGTEITIDFTGTSATTATTGLLETNNSTTVGDSVSGIEIGTSSGARDALDVIDSALETINTIRADLGAVNNRLDFTVSNLANVIENTESSRSRIMDADFAAETSSLSRSQVLQQASQAMLAQANARPQQVLQLLQG